jgi:hypothetical protein
MIPTENTTSGKYKRHDDAFKRHAQILKTPAEFLPFKGKVVVVIGGTGVLCGEMAAGRSLVKVAAHPQRTPALKQ